MSNKIKFLDVSDIRNIIDSIPNNKQGTRDRAILETLFSTGLRVSELCALRINDIKLDNLNETQEISIVGKGNYQRVIFISPIALRAIDEYIKIYPPKFQRLFPVTPRAVQLMIKKYAGRNITPHMFRHSFATYLLKKGVNLRYVQNFLGHRNLSTTEVYTHCTDKDLRDVHKSLMK